MAEPITNVLGIVGIKHCGEYDSTIYYEKLNVVSYNGSSYCAKTSTQGNNPTDTNYWDLMAEKGDTGATGQEGYTPVKGVDYYTNADKEEFKEFITTDVSEEVATRLDDLTSATPTAVSSVAEMTDTTRIYVNTNDNNWYYYDGDSWEIGGVYQATGISDKSITPSKLAYYDLLSTSLNIFDYKTLIYGGYINGSTGVITSGTSGTGLDCYTPEIAVTPGTIYYMKNVGHNVIFYDNSHNYLSSVSPQINNTVTVPESAAYMRMSLKSSGNDLSTFCVSTTDAASKYFYQFKNLINDDTYLYFISAQAYLDVDWENSKVYIRNGGSVNIVNNKVQYQLHGNVTEDYELLSFAGSQYTLYIYYDKAQNKLISVTPSNIATYSSDYIFMGYINKQAHKFFIKGYGSSENLHKIAYLYYFQKDTKVDVDWENSKVYIRNARYVGVNCNKKSYNLHPDTLEDYELLDFSNTIYTQYIYYNIANNSIVCVTPANLYTLNENYAYLGYVIKAGNSFYMNGLLYNPEAKLVNYSIGSDLIKRPIYYQKIGEIANVQSFCKYGDYYYSTNGTSIIKQDSDFETVDTVSLSTGHGNNFQLGNNGKAYISGWNDNTVYVIDLETLTIDSTIILPTTGYTTVAIDDINKLAYIFQRDTIPSQSNAYYNFIVYNYQTETIISTKKTTRAFGAMQACDYFEDKIIVLNGLGNSTIPNGYVVYDLNGNILTSYKLDINNEPEGVCVDRQTKELLISFYNKNVYKISQ